MHPLRILTLLCGLLVSAWLVPTAQSADPAELPEPDPDEPLNLGKIRVAIDPGGHTTAINRTFFSADDRQLITVSTDHSIRIWDVQTGTTRHVYYPPGTGPLQAASLSRDGRLLAVATLYPDGEKLLPLICLIDLAEGKLRGPALRGHTGPIRALSLSADGKRLASCGDDGTVRIWDLDEKPVSRELYHSPRGTSLVAVALSPDGTRVAFSPGRGCSILDAATGKSVANGQGARNEAFRTLAWGPDGKSVAGGGHNGLRLWDNDGTLRWHKLRTHAIHDVAFSRDSSRVLALGNDRGAHRPTVLDTSTGVELGAFRLRGQFEDRPGSHVIRDGAISTEGLLAATSGGGNGIHETLLWRTREGSLVRQLAARSWLTGPHPRVGWGLDGKTVTWGEKVRSPEGPGRLRSFDLAELQFGPDLEATSVRTTVHEQGALTLKRNRQGAAEVSRGGSQVAAIREGGPSFAEMTFVGRDHVALLMPRALTISLYDAATGKQKGKLQGHRNFVWSIAPSPNGGRYLASISADQTLRIWNPERETSLLSHYLSGEDWVVWTEEGYYAASPGGEKLVGWVIDNGPDQLASFYPAQRFRKHIYRPDIIKQVFEKGSLEAALKAVRGEARELAAILPPKATLRVEQDGAKVKVEVSAEARSPGQQVTELHLLVDGRPVLACGKAAVETFAPGKEKGARAEWTVSLEPGEHKVRARAHGPDSYSLTEEVAVAVAATAPPRRSGHGVLYYLGIGVNHFKNHPELELKGAVHDVNALEECLQRTCSARFKDIQPVLLTEEKATRGAVLQALAELQGKVKASDVVIVHYSSHGEVDGDGGLYLLTSDSKRDSLAATAVPGQKLRDLLGQYQSQVLLVLDACHSGKFPLIRPATDPLSRLLADDSCGVAVLAASLAHQKAEDREGGVFTQALIAGLDGKAKPDEESTQLFVHNPYGYVYTSVTRETSNRQMPLYLPSGSAPPIVLKE
jgi:WD40 repeat protein